MNQSKFEMKLSSDDEAKRSKVHKSSLARVGLSPCGVPLHAPSVRSHIDLRGEQRVWKPLPSRRVLKL